MNKYQEALDILKKCNMNKTEFNHIGNEFAERLYIASIETLQELVDRATPIKPIFYKPLNTFNGSDIEQPFYIIKCGKCEYWLEPIDKFCSNCGTEIEWNKYEPK